MSSDISDYSQIKVGLLQQRKSMSLYSQLRNQLVNPPANDKSKKAIKFNFNYQNLFTYMNQIIKQHKAKPKYAAPSVLNIYRKDRRDSNQQSIIFLRSNLHTAAQQSWVTSQRDKEESMSEVQSWIQNNSFSKINKIKRKRKHRSPYRAQSSIATHKGTPNNSSAEHIGKLNSFIIKCNDIQHKTMYDNRNIRTAATIARQRIHEISNTNPRSTNKPSTPINETRSYSMKAFIYGKKMEGRFIQGKFDDIVENCNRIAHADYRLANEYKRLIKKKCDY
jgi:hypothetical protein